MSTRQVTICTAGECEGECYRCRMNAFMRENEMLKSALKFLFDERLCAGTFGPWHDNWTDDWQWLHEQVQEADNLPKEFAPERSQLAVAREEYEREKQRFNP